jgi:hypothetical protein
MLLAFDLDLSVLKGAQRTDEMGEVLTSRHKSLRRLAS